MGGNATQFSLASVETIPHHNSWDSIQSRNGSNNATVSPLGDPPSSIPDLPITRPMVQLSAISEANSNDGRNSPSEAHSTVSNSHRVVDPPIQEASPPELIRNHVQTNTRISQPDLNQPPREPPLNPDPSGGRESDEIPRVSSRRGRAKDRITAFIGRFSNGLSKRKRSGLVAHSRPEESNAITAQEISAHHGQATAFYETLQHPQTNGDVPQRSRENDETMIQGPIFDNSPNHETGGASRVRDANQRQQLKETRHEKTVQSRQILSQSCTCEAGCSCRIMTGSNYLGSNESNEPARRSSVDPDIPIHPLHGLLFDDSSETSLPTSEHPRLPSPSRHVAFEHVGTHLEPDQRPPSRMGSSSGPSENWRRSRVSTTSWGTSTTAVDSIRGSSRGGTTRPATRRALSLPTVPAHEVEIRSILEQYGPGVRRRLREIQDIDRLFSEGGSASQASDEDPLEHFAEAQRIEESHDSADRNNETSSHNSAISLSNLPEPTDEQRERSEHSESDTASHEPAPAPAHTVNGSNPEQEHNPQDVPPPPPQPGPDELSMALEDLDGHGSTHVESDQDSSTAEAVEN